MTENHGKIIEILSSYLDKYPDQRFAQALFNLNINQFKNIKVPENDDFSLRDIYADADTAILTRMIESYEIFSSYSFDT
jgi:hypothetical protein